MRGDTINWQRKVGSIQDLAPAIVPDLELGAGGVARAEIGKQYVVIAAGGHARIGTTTGDYVIAYALPD